MDESVKEKGINREIMKEGSVKFYGKGIERRDPFLQCCYFNTTVQCLMHVKDFFTKLSQNCSLEENSFSSILCSLFRNFTNPILKIISPKNVLDYLANLDSKFNGASQQDVNDLIFTIFETLHSEIRDTNGNSFIKKLFSIAIERVTKCTNLNCAQETKSFVEENLLPLSVEGQDLQNCLKLHFSSALDCKCDNCGSVKNQTEYGFKSSPKNLIIFLKRYKTTNLSFYDQQKYQSNKIEKTVKYPPELDISEFATRSCTDQNFKYVLHSIILHHSNHYTSLNKEGEDWYLYNDTVREKKQKEYTENNSYAVGFLYTRVDDTNQTEREVWESEIDCLDNDQNDTLVQDLLTAQSELQNKISELQIQKNDYASKSSNLEQQNKDLNQQIEQLVQQLDRQKNSTQCEPIFDDFDIPSRNENCNQLEQIQQLEQQFERFNNELLEQVYLNSQSTAPLPPDKEPDSSPYNVGNVDDQNYSNDSEAGDDGFPQRSHFTGNSNFIHDQNRSEVNVVPNSSTEWANTATAQYAEFIGTQTIGQSTNSSTQIHYQMPPNSIETEHLSKLIGFTSKNQLDFKFVKKGIKISGSKETELVPPDWILFSRKSLLGEYNPIGNTLKEDFFMYVKTKLNITCANEKLWRKVERTDVEYIEFYTYGDNKTSYTNNSKTKKPLYFVCIGFLDRIATAIALKTIKKVPFLNKFGSELVTAVTLSYSFLFEIDCSSKDLHNYLNSLPSRGNRSPKDLVQSIDCYQKNKNIPITILNYLDNLSQLLETEERKKLFLSILIDNNLFGFKNAIQEIIKQRVTAVIEQQEQKLLEEKLIMENSAHKRILSVALKAVQVKLETATSDSAYHLWRQDVEELKNILPPLVKIKSVQKWLFSVIKGGVLVMQSVFDDNKFVGIKFNVPRSIIMSSIPLFISTNMNKLSFLFLRLLMDAGMIGGEAHTILACQVIGKQANQSPHSLQTLSFNFKDEKEATKYFVDIWNACCEYKAIDFFGAVKPLILVLCGDMPAQFKMIGLELPNCCLHCNGCNKCSSPVHVGGFGKCACESICKCADIKCKCGDGCICVRNCVCDRLINCFKTNISTQFYEKDKTKSYIKILRCFVKTEIVHCILRLLEQIIKRDGYLLNQAGITLEDQNEYNSQVLFNGSKSVVLRNREDTKIQNKGKNNSSKLTHPSNIQVGKGSLRGRELMVYERMKILNQINLSEVITKSVLKVNWENLMIDIMTLLGAIIVEEKHRSRECYWNQWINSSNQMIRCVKLFLLEIYNSFCKFDDNNFTENVKELYKLESELLLLVLKKYEHGFVRKDDVQYIFPDYQNPANQNSINQNSANHNSSLPSPLIEEEQNNARMSVFCTNYRQMTKKSKITKSIVCFWIKFEGHNLQEQETLDFFDHLNIIRLIVTKFLRTTITSWYDHDLTHAAQDMRVSGPSDVFASSGLERDIGCIKDLDDRSTNNHSKLTEEEDQIQERSCTSREKIMIQKASVKVVKILRDLLNLPEDRDHHIAAKEVIKIGGKKFLVKDLDEKQFKDFQQILNSFKAIFGEKGKFVRYQKSPKKGGKPYYVYKYETINQDKNVSPETIGINLLNEEEFNRIKSISNQPESTQEEKETENEMQDENQEISDQLENDENDFQVEDTDLEIAGFAEEVTDKEAEDQSAHGQLLPTNSNGKATNKKKRQNDERNVIATKGAKKAKDSQTTLNFPMEPRRYPQLTIEQVDDGKRKEPINNRSKFFSTPVRPLLEPPSDDGNYEMRPWIIPQIMEIVREKVLSKDYAGLGKYIFQLEEFPIDKRDWNVDTE